MKKIIHNNKKDNVIKFQVIFKSVLGHFTCRDYRLCHFRLISVSILHKYVIFIKFLQICVILEYENERQVGENFIDCSKGRPPNTRDKVCRFNVDLLGPDCTWQKDYGYDEGQPCILLKINRVGP